MAAPAADPFSAFAGSFGSGLGKGVGELLGGGGGPFIGGASAANSFGTTQDGSGWIVNVGGQQSATASPVRTTNNTPSLYDPGAQWAGAPQQAGLSTGAAVLLLLVVGGFLLRKRKG